LVNGGYLKLDDLKVCGAGSIVRGKNLDTFDATKECGFKVYDVSHKDIPETIFLSSRSVIMEGTVAKMDPQWTDQFKSKASFVLFQKGGNGSYHLRTDTKTKNGPTPQASSAALPTEGFVRRSENQ